MIRASNWMWKQATPSLPSKAGFIGMSIEFRITELNRRRNRAIFSERAALEAVKIKLKSERIKELNVGDVVKGKVLGTSKFGVFVEMDGADGLIHISELSWGPVKNPEDFVTVGTDMDVYVLKIDRETLKIALSLRRLTPEPWEQIQSGLEIGQTVTGTITKLANFGAFARIENNKIYIEAELFSIDGKKRFYNKASKNIDQALELGKEVGEILKKKSKNSYKR